jgi:hypothetical protein
MKTPTVSHFGTELPRRTGLGRLAVGALVAVGVALAATSPAMADNWKHNGHGNWNNGHWDNGHGNKHWKKQHRYQYSHGGYYYYQPQPQVIYVQPQPVYLAPPPPVYYVQPAPVYRRPEINIVFPLDFD